MGIEKLEYYAVFRFRLYRDQRYHTLPLARGHDRAVFFTPGTGAFSGFFIIAVWHVVDNGIFFRAIGAGETDNVPGPRPVNLGFY